MFGTHRRHSHTIHVVVLEEEVFFESSERIVAGGAGWVRGGKGSWCKAIAAGRGEGAAATGHHREMSCASLSNLRRRIVVKGRMHVVGADLPHSVGHEISPLLEVVPDFSFPFIFWCSFLPERNGKKQYQKMGIPRRQSLPRSEECITIGRQRRRVYVYSKESRGPRAKRRYSPIALVDRTSRRRQSSCSLVVTPSLVLMVVITGNSSCVTLFIT